MTDRETPIEDRGIDEQGTDGEPQEDETVVRERTVIADEKRSPTEYLELAAIAGLIVVAAVAGFGFYTSASGAIDRLISPDYEPIFQAAFNLTLLLFALAGLSVLARRRLDLA